MSTPTPPPLFTATGATPPAQMQGPGAPPPPPPPSGPAVPPTGPNFVKGGQPMAPPTGAPVGVPTYGAAPGGPTYGATPPGPGYGAGAPPAVPTFSGTRGYDGPPAPSRYVLAALGISAFAGLLVSGNSPGLALALVALAVVIATRLLESPRGRFGDACLVAAGALAVVPMLRDSGWVGTLSLLGAMALAAIAVSTPGTWRELGVAAFGWMGHLIPAPVRLLAKQGAGIAGVRWGQCAPIVRGALLGGTLLLIFGTLFASADARFADIAEDIVSIDLSFDQLVERVWIVAIVLACAGALWFTAVTRKERPAQEPQTKLGATEWNIALGSLALMFAGFVALQLDMMFGGNDVVQLTAGLTYAEYARQGFGQMTVAAILTLGVVAAAVRYGPAEDRWVRLLCGVLALLTLVVLGSAMHRLGLYQDAYGSTRVRFSMTALMYWLGAVLIAVVVAGAAGRTSLLPRTVVLISAVFAIGTVAINPDHRIAERNVQRFTQTDRLDTGFLTTLSADALPALAALPADRRACIEQHFESRLGKSDPVQSWNLGRARGRDVLAADGRQPCSGGRP